MQSTITETKTDSVTTKIEESANTSCTEAPSCVEKAPMDYKALILWVVVLIFIILWTIAIFCCSSWCCGDKDDDSCSEDHGDRFGGAGLVLLWFIGIVILIAVAWQFEWVGLVVLIIIVIIIGAIWCGASWCSKGKGKKNSKCD